MNNLLKSKDEQDLFSQYMEMLSSNHISTKNQGNLIIQKLRKKHLLGLKWGLKNNRIKFTRKELLRYNIYFKQYKSQERNSSSSERSYEIKYQKIKILFKNLLKEKTLLEKQNSTLLFHIQELKKTPIKETSNQQYFKQLRKQEFDRLQEELKLSKNALKSEQDLIQKFQKKNQKLKLKNESYEKQIESFQQIQKQTQEQHLQSIQNIQKIYEEGLQSQKKDIEYYNSKYEQSETEMASLKKNISFLNQFKQNFDNLKLCMQTKSTQTSKKGNYMYSLHSKFKIVKSDLLDIKTEYDLQTKQYKLFIKKYQKEISATLNNSSSQIRSLNQELKQSKEIESQQKDTIQQLQQNISSIQNKLQNKNYEDKLAQYQDMVKSLKIQITSNDKSLESLKKEKNQLQNKNKSLLETIECLEEQNSDLLSSMQELESLQNNNFSSFQQKSEENIKLQQEINSTEEQKNLQIQLNKEKDIFIAQLQETISELQKSLESTQEAMNKQVLDINDNQQISEVDSIIPILQQKVEELQKSNKKLKDSLFKNESTISKINKEKEGIHLECCMIFQEFESAQIQLQFKNEKIQKMTQELKTNLNKTRDLQLELDKIKTSLKSQQTELNHNIDSLNTIDQPQNDNSKQSNQQHLINIEDLKKEYNQQIEILIKKFENERLQDQDSIKELQNQILKQQDQHQNELQSLIEQHFKNTSEMNFNFIQEKQTLEEDILQKQKELDSMEKMIPQNEFQKDQNDSLLFKLEEEIEFLQEQIKQIEERHSQERELLIIDKEQQMNRDLQRILDLEEQLNDQSSVQDSEKNQKLIVQLQKEFFIQLQDMSYGVKTYFFKEKILLRYRCIYAFSYLKSIQQCLLYLKIN